MMCRAGSPHHRLISILRRFVVIAFGGSRQQPRDEFLPPACRDQVEPVEQEAEGFRGEVRDLHAQRKLKGAVGPRMAQRPISEK